MSEIVNIKLGQSLPGERWAALSTAIMETNGYGCQYS